METVNIREIKEREIRVNGDKLVFNNERHQVEVLEDDDIRGGEAFFNRESGWRRGFLIFFNGGCIHHCLTFKSFINRMEKLIEKWDLDVWVERDDNDFIN
jgi:hypothetical protein